MRKSNQFFLRKSNQILKCHRTSMFCCYFFKWILQKLKWEVGIQMECVTAVCNSRAYRLLNRTLLMFLFFKLWNNIIFLVRFFWFLDNTGMVVGNRCLFIKSYSVWISYAWRRQWSNCLLSVCLYHCRQQNLSSRFSKIESKCFVLNVLKVIDSSGLYRVFHHHFLAIILG